MGCDATEDGVSIAPERTEQRRQIRKGGLCHLESRATGAAHLAGWEGESHDDDLIHEEEAAIGEEEYCANLI